MNIPPVRHTASSEQKQLLFLTTRDAGGRLQSDQALEGLQRPQVPAFFSPAKEEEKRFIFLQISIVSPDKGES